MFWQPCVKKRLHLKWIKNYLLAKGIYYDSKTRIICLLLNFTDRWFAKVGEILFKPFAFSAQLFLSFWKLLCFNREQVWMGILTLFMTFYYCFKVTALSMHSAQWSKGVTKPIFTFRRFCTFSNLYTDHINLWYFWCFWVEKKTLQKSWVKPLWKENGFLLHKIHFFIH